MTKYIVLCNSGGWKEMANIEAATARAAVRKALDGADIMDGTYVAIPERSWKPVTVKVETKTAVQFS